MAVRLSNYIREQVRDAILAHSFSDREKALDAREKELALEFYNDLYPEAIRAHMYALPNGFLEVRSSIRVQVVGESYHSLDLPEKKRVADCWSHNPGKVYEADHPLGEKLRTYLKDRAQFKREREEAKTGAWAVLESVTTVKKLIEVWPEVEQFARPFAVESPSRAIALPIKDLNARLGLPPQTASA
ncbi:hypothetical protein [Pseudomonas phage PSA20]|nr:hypothetical protein [Pseudomonas phage PSA20]